MSLQVTVDDGINELEISSVGGFGSVGTVVRGGPLGGQEQLGKMKTC